MKPKTNAESLANETGLLLRYACERYVRAAFARASGSAIRIIARKCEKAAIKTLLEETKNLPVNKRK